MGAPAWTAKEISALEEMTAKYPLPTVARKLNPFCERCIFKTATARYWRA